MAQKLSPDKLLFLVTVLLALFGVVMVNSASSVLSTKYYGPFSYLFLRQFVYTFAGLITMWFVMKIDYRHYDKRLLIFSGLGLCFWLLIAVLFQSKSNNVHRWLHIGSVAFQPSEITKLVVILFLASYLRKWDGEINEFWRVLVPCLAIVCALAGLILAEPDLGTASSLVVISLIVLFSAGLRWRYLLTLLTLSAPIVVLIISRNVYQKNRILSFLSNDDPLGMSYQIRQSLIAIGSGGLTGLGLGEGKQKLFFLPQPHSDFIFSIIGEELGLIGTLTIVLGFALFFWRGMRTVLRVPDKFGFYLALGLTLMIVVQGLINISVVLQLMPTKGIPLPFISMGGSSVLVNLVAAGILLNVSQHSR